jgi:hypothetical protein
MSRKAIEQQARLLAKENRNAEPEITNVYWFPNETEVRLVEVLPAVPPSGDRVVPFYFRPQPADNLPAPSGIALVRPDEVRNLPLPKGWGQWEDAVELACNGEDDR